MGEDAGEEPGEELGRVQGLGAGRGPVGFVGAIGEHRPDPASKILGIVRVDLFVPVLTFVFGQAQLDGPGAVVSTYRLRTKGCSSSGP